MGWEMTTRWSGLQRAVSSSDLLWGEAASDWRVRTFLTAVFVVLSACSSATSETSPTTTVASSLPVTSSAPAASTTTTTAPDRTTSTTIQNPGFVGAISPLDQEMLGHSWHEGCPVGAEDLQLVTFSYWGFDGVSRDGNIVVNSEVSRAVLAVFDSLFDNRYPIESVIPIGDLPVDAEDRPDYNNTSGFHCRVVEGTNRWSDHAYGLAIDLNPLLNPFVGRDGEVWPTGGERYLDRGLAEPGMIDPAGGVVLAFESIGWEWGGNWQSIKDYHHFFAPLR